MENGISSPAEVAKALQEDIVEHLQISIAEAAKQMGKPPHTLYNILRGKSRISFPLAQLLHETFNYNVKFLTAGEGELREEDHFALKIGSGDEAKTFVLRPGEYMFIDGVYYPRQRIVTERESLLQKSCKLFYETIRFFQDNGVIELDYSQLDDGSKFKEYDFNPISPVEGDLFNTLTFYYSQVKQLTDLHLILKHLNQDPAPQI